MMKKTTAVLILFLNLTVCAGQEGENYLTQGNNFLAQKEFDKAIAIFKKAIDIRSAKDKNEETYILINTGLSKAYLGIREYRIGIEYALKAITEVERLNKYSDTLYWQNLKNIGTMYSRLESYDSATIFFLKAQNVIEQTYGVESLVNGNICSSIFLNYYNSGDYKAAEATFLKGKKILEGLQAQRSYDYMALVSNAGMLYIDKGDQDMAEAMWEKSLELRETLYGSQSPLYAGMLLNLSMVYENKGDYAKAEGAILNAREVFNKSAEANASSIATSCLRLGAIYEDIGSYDKSLQYYIEAKSLFEKLYSKKSRQYTTSLIHIADVKIALNQFNEANQILNETLIVNKELYGINHPAYSSNLKTLAEVYIALKNYQKAEDYLLEAKQIHSSSISENSGDYASVLTLFGDMFFDQAEFDSAQKYYHDAVTISDRTAGVGNPTSLNIVMKQAMSFWALNNYSEVDKLLKQYAVLKDKEVKNVFSFTSEHEQEKFLNNRTHLYQLYSFFYRSNKNADFVYSLILQQRNLTLTSSQQLRQIVYKNSDSILVERYNRWIGLKKELASNYSRNLQDRVSNLSELEQKANDLEKELRKLSRAFEIQQDKQNISWIDIQKSLAKDEAAIEFTEFQYYNGKRWTDSVFYIAVLNRRDRSPEIITLFEKSELEKIIPATGNKNQITSIYTKAPNPRQSIGSTLYGLIWKPIEGKLEGIKTIFYSPAGLLHRISFSAMPVRPQFVLGSQYRLKQLSTTMTVVNKTEDELSKVDKIALYGGISYSADSLVLKKVAAKYNLQKENSVVLRSEDLRGDVWEELPGTLEEIDSIKNTANLDENNVSSFSGEEATEESLKNLNGKNSPTVMHIATHGFFFSDPQLSLTATSKKSPDKNGIAFKTSTNVLFRSGLLFAGANHTWMGKPIKNIEDGVLTAYEVSNLSLLNTKLAVLSACETALGDIHGSEGVYGLQRAFKVAGVKNLVMSLWKVPDLETSEFMKEFYKNIFSNQSISDAFYNTQNILKYKYKNDPYKWAAWLLVQ